MALQDTGELRKWLGNVDFPTDKATLVDRAEKNGAPKQVVEALRSMQPVEYADRSEVMASVPLQDGRSSHEKAEEHRRHNHSGLAEQSTETPSHPIVEELGENRGS